MNELNKELERFLALLDGKIDAINLNLDKCQKIAGNIIDDLKKFQSGLLPEKEEDEELEAANKELELDHEKQMKEEEGLIHEEENL